MKTAALISALLITGCAAQPQQMTTAPATYTAPVSRESECIHAMSSLLAYARAGSPVLKKCFAGDNVQCDAFVLFRNDIHDKLRTDEAIDCIETGGISPYHPLAVMTVNELDSFTKQLKRFNGMKRR